MSKKRKSTRSGFTLIEILIVLVVVTLLAAILFAVFARVREKGRSGVCQSNLKQIALAFQQYVQENDGRYPQPVTTQVNDQKLYWVNCLSPYIKDRKVFFCPNLVSSRNPVFQQTNTTYEFNGFVIEQLSVSPPKVRLEGNFHESIIKSPSEVILNFDLTGDAALDAKVPVSSSGCTDIAAPNAPDFDMPALHSGGANYSFYDGHVKWLSPEEAAKVGCNSQLKP